MVLISIYVRLYTLTVSENQTPHFGKYWTNSKRTVATEKQRGRRSSGGASVLNWRKLQPWLG